MRRQTQPNDYSANSLGSMPAVMMRGKLGILLDLDSAPNTLQLEPTSVSTLGSANGHASDLPTLYQRFSNATHRHTMIPSIQAVDVSRKQVVVWPATNNTVGRFFNSLQNQSRKSRPNLIPPAYLWTLPPFASLWIMPTRGIRHLVQALYHRSSSKTCIARTTRHSQ